MKVEATLIQKMSTLHEGVGTGKRGFVSEWNAWKRLFAPEYRERTLIGVLVMVFQREFSAGFVLFSILLLT